mmetsp:Transcript_12720/g.28109  ORF Transcript_12720/g.28109 Transcript_12720/m.28109 type:complete len:399 (+) Transcript_12720:640-1836(+)
MLFQLHLFLRHSATFRIEEQGTAGCCSLIDRQNIPVGACGPLFFLLHRVEFLQVHRAGDSIPPSSILAVADGHAHLVGKALPPTSMHQHLLHFFHLLVEVDRQASSEGSTQDSGLGHPGSEHLDSEEVCLKLHQEVVSSHAAIDMHASKFMADILLHGLHDVDGAESNGLQSCTAEVGLVGVQGHANSDCSGILTPVRSEETRKGRNERDTTGVCDRAGELLDLRGTIDETHVVAEPLHSASSASNRAFQGILGLGVRAELEADSRQQAALGRNGLVASVEQHEASSAVGVLGGADFKAALAQQSSMLIAQSARDGDAIQRAKSLHLPVDLSIGLDDRQTLQGNSQFVANFRIPSALLQIEEHVSGCIGKIGHMETAILATSQIEDQPRFDGSEHAVP